MYVNGTQGWGWPEMWQLLAVVLYKDYNYMHYSLKVKNKAALYRCAF